MNLESFVKLEEAFSHIRFYEKDHSYKINGVTTKYSVTKLIKKYEKPFETDEIAENVAKKRSISKEDIIKSWDFTRDYATHKGSEFHLFVENFLQRRQVTIDRDAIVDFLSKHKALNTIEEYYSEFAVLVKNFIEFYEWWKQDYILIKPEFVIGDADASVGGTIDNLSYNKKTNKLALFDYKTNKKMDSKNKWGNKLLPPFDYLPSCEMTTYSLQLHLYKLLIEKHTSFEVETPHIIWVTNPDGYKLIEVKDLSKEAKKILNDAFLKG